MNVEAFGGFFEPGTDSGLKHARVAFSPNGVLEYRVGTTGGWADLAALTNGQLRISLQKGNNLIQFRHKQSERMPSRGRRTIRVNLLAMCSDCRGAPGGTAITSDRTVFTNDYGRGNQSSTYEVYGDQNCRAANHARVFSHNRPADCRIRTSSTPGDNGRHTWETCDPFSNNPESPYSQLCSSVSGGIGSPVCTSQAVYMCSTPVTSPSQQRPNTPTYRVVNNPNAIFEVQTDSDYCM